GSSRSRLGRTGGEHPARNDDDDGPAIVGTRRHRPALSFGDQRPAAGTESATVADGHQSLAISFMVGGPDASRGACAWFDGPVPPTYTIGRALVLAAEHRLVRHAAGIARSVDGRADPGRVECRAVVFIRASSAQGEHVVAVARAASAVVLDIRDH